MLDLDTEWFVPRLVKNLDVSSTRRLRIPYEKIVSRMQNSPALHGRTSAFQFFNQYLSLRIFESTEYFGVYFFQSAQMLSGVLIELRSEEEGRSPFEIDASESQEIGTFLVDARKNLSGHKLKEHFELSDIESELDRLISKAEQDESKIYIFFLNLTAIVKAISAKYPFIEEYYLQKDIQGTLSLLSGEEGFCSTLGSNTTILAIKSRGLKRSNVLIHQMKHLVQERFASDDVVLPDLQIQTRSWPIDGKDSFNLLKDYRLSEE
ncbi:MAG: hypothetical protein R6V86_05230 [Spirochaetia bacterium]